MHEPKEALQLRQKCVEVAEFGKLVQVVIDEELEGSQALGGSYRLRQFFPRQIGEDLALAALDVHLDHIHSPAQCRNQLRQAPHVLHPVHEPHGVVDAVGPDQAAAIRPVRAELQAALLGLCGLGDLGVQVEGLIRLGLVRHGAAKAEEAAARILGWSGGARAGAGGAFHQRLKIQCRGMQFLSCADHRVASPLRVLLHVFLQHGKGFGVGLHRYHCGSAPRRLHREASDVGAQVQHGLRPHPRARRGVPLRERIVLALVQVQGLQRSSPRGLVRPLREHLLQDEVVPMITALLVFGDGAADVEFRIWEKGFAHGFGDGGNGVEGAERERSGKRGAGRALGVCRFVGGGSLLGGGLPDALHGSGLLGGGGPLHGSGLLRSGSLGSGRPFPGGALRLLHRRHGCA
mmetsp:Transcript_72006/g.188707  ORF Transcript_72006/g.188707 Transcript_72006/m.188707 type:complete len:404 (+) Transcript_72006:232-1443(+)